MKQEVQQWLLKQLFWMVCLVNALSSIILYYDVVLCLKENAKEKLSCEIWSMLQKKQQKEWFILRANMFKWRGRDYFILNDVVMFAKYLNFESCRQKFKRVLMSLCFVKFPKARKVMKIQSE